MQTLEPMNVICPKCGKPSYMYHIPWAKGELNCKCINCNRYFNAAELYGMTTRSN